MLFDGGRVPFCAMSMFCDGIRVGRVSCGQRGVFVLRHDCCRSRRSDRDRDRDGRRDRDRDRDRDGRRDRDRDRDGRRDRDRDERRVSKHMLLIFCGKPGPC